MSSSPGERVCALLHHGLILQTKLDEMKSRRIHFMEASELEKVRKALERHFPRYDEAAKQKGWEKLKDPKDAKNFHDALKFSYDTLKECMIFREAVLPALRSAASAIEQDPLRDTRPFELFWPGAASRGFLDLIVLYAKICCQIERGGSDCRSIVAGYNAAYATLNQNKDDEAFKDLTIFLKPYESSHMNGPSEVFSILRTVAQEVMENGDTIVLVVSYLIEMVKPWFLAMQDTSTVVWQSLINSACFISDAAPVPADITKSAQVCYREQARGWIIWCSLICPASLACSRAKFSDLARHEALLRSVLAETIVEVIYRDEVLRVHENFYELFSWFPSKITYTGIRSEFEEFFVASKNLKKFMRDCSITCTNKGGLIHRERRITLIQLLLNASHKLQANPAQLGPKGPAFVAVLSAAKEEINWYITHCHQAPPKIHAAGMSIGGILGSDNAARYKKDEWVDHARVGMLIWVHGRLLDEVRALWWIFQRYLFESLRGTFYVECTSRNLVEHANLLERLPAPPFQDISSLLNEARLLDMLCETSKGPASNLIPYSSSHGEYFLPHFFFLLDLLGDGYVEDNNDGEAGFTDPGAIRQFCSLKQVVSFPDIVKEMLDETLRINALHCVGFLDALSSAHDLPNQVMAWTPEVPSPGERAKKLADHILKRIQDYLVQSLDELAMRYGELQAQTNSIRAAERQMRLRARKLAGKAKSDGSSNSLESGLNRWDARPGFESRPQYRDQLGGVSAAQRSVRGIAAGLSRTQNGIVLIWDRAYVLREFLRETLMNWLERRFQSRCSGGPMIARPTILYTQSMVDLDVIRFACEHSGFDAAHISRAIWIRETSGGNPSVSDLVSQWLLKFIDTILESPGNAVIYSEVTRGFIKVPEIEGRATVGAPPSPGGSMRAEMWLDQREMDGLIALLGTRGATVVMGHLRAFVRAKIVELKRCLFEDEPTLSALRRMTLFSEAGCVRQARTVKHADLIVRGLRSIGAAAKVSEMLRNGISGSNIWTESDVRAFLGEMEVAPALWATLSQAVASSLCSTEFWKESELILRLDGHANNVHLVATALHLLLRQSQDPKHLRSRELEAVVAFASIVLEMKTDYLPEYNDWPLRGVTLFLEKLVDQSAFLRLPDLDEVLPFSMRHSIIVDHLIGKSKGSDLGISPELFAKRILESSKPSEDEPVDQGDDSQATRQN